MGHSCRRLRERSVLWWDRLACLPCPGCPHCCLDLSSHDYPQRPEQVKDAMFLHCTPTCDCRPKLTWLSCSGHGSWPLLGDWLPWTSDPVLGLWVGASLLLTHLQVMVLLFQSDQPIPAATSWHLKLIWVMFSAFGTIYTLIMVQLYCRRHLTVGWRSRCSWLSLLPAIHRDGLVESTFPTLSPSPPLGPYTWVRQFGLWWWLPAERDHPLWATSWVITRMKRVGVYMEILP